MDIDTELQLALKHYQAGELKEAEIIYRNILTFDPCNIRALNYLGNIFQGHCKYENIIQHEEDISRKLLEFCGLEWDPACLDFYKKDRSVFTAGNWQVRQPIHTTSCGRWRNYEQFLDPLKKLLKDFI